MRGVLLVLLLLVIGAVGTMLLRYWNHEEELAIRKALVHARSKGGSPADVEPEWQDLAASLRSRLAKDPNGSLARLAFAASARVTLTVPRSFSMADRPQLPVVYGGRDPDEIPLPDRPYLWAAVIEGAWGQGAWHELGRGTWGPDGETRGEIDIAAVLPEEIPDSGWVTLRVRAILKLYTDSHAIEASAASTPEAFAAIPVTYQERRSLSGYRVQILDPQE
jgi:hypothetical protein